MRDDGGPALPQFQRVALPAGGYAFDAVGGMTLRDYFAAQAMSAMLSSEIRQESWASVGSIALDSYKMADAMLAERSKP